MTDYENKQSQDFQDPAPQPAHTPSPQEERPQAEPAPPQPEAPVYQEAPKLCIDVGIRYLPIH